MRSDLNKQLCERERLGSKYRYKDVRRNKKFNQIGEEGENLPQFESTMHRHNKVGRTKDFNENLNPLYSQIRKAVGRPWAKFYSELCKTFDKRSVINQHILQHLYDRLAVNLRVKDGELWVHPRYGSPRPLSEESYTEYYVDPRDDIIKINKAFQAHKRARQAEKLRLEAETAAKERWLDVNHVLRVMDGVWFHFTMKDLPPAKYVYEKPLGVDQFQIGHWNVKTKVWDQLNEYEREKHGKKRLVGERRFDEFHSEHRSLADRFNRETRYHSNKKTASHKQLKQAGII